MKLLKVIMNYLTSRYSKLQLLAVAVLIIFAFFVSESNIFARLGYDAKINSLNKQIKYYREQTVKDKEKLNHVSSNKDDIEKFARESYLMKKANEDIYIIEK